MPTKYAFAEFFSGGGMARAGLGDAWDCVLANDIDPKKCAVYQQNWPSDHLYHCDIADLPSEPLQRHVDLYWASSPCQDFSLAGKGNGLSGGKSSAFFPWVEQVKRAVNAGFAPKIIAFENVAGLLSANGGKDFAAVVQAISRLGYRVGAQIIDAKNFIPHSRPRLFVIGIHDHCTLPAQVIGTPAQNPSSQIHRAFTALSPALHKRWVWWRYDIPSVRNTTLADIIEPDVANKQWFTKTQTTNLIRLMNDLHRQKLTQAKGADKLIIGTVYRRGRPDGTGKTVQRAELRLDGIAGCLRTPGGGSSRQTVMFIKGAQVRARLLTARESARLMGLPDSFKMPQNYNDAYQLTGDGVVVPVVRHLANTLFEPILNSQAARKAA